MSEERVGGQGYESYSTISQVRHAHEYLFSLSLSVHFLSMANGANKGVGENFDMQEVYAILCD